MTWRKDWLSTLTPAQRARVRRVLEARYPRPSYGYRQGQLAGWSVLLDRSVGVPREIVLRRRDGSGRIVERIPIDASP